MGQKSTWLVKIALVANNKVNSLGSLRGHFTKYTHLYVNFSYCYGEWEREFLWTLLEYKDFKGVVSLSLSV